MRSSCEPLSLCFLVLSWRVAVGNQRPQSLLSATINGRGQLGVSADRAASTVKGASGQPVETSTVGRGDISLQSTQPSPQCLQNVIQRDPHNIGASTAGPLLYAQSLGFKGCVGHNPVDLFANEAAFKDIANQPLIFGGGGLLNISFDDPSARVFSNAKGPIVLWGVGFSNYAAEQAAPTLPAYLANASNVKLIGLRDWFNEDRPLLSRKWLLTAQDQSPLDWTRSQIGMLRWVPCASAMNPAFDRYLNYDSFAIPNWPTKRRFGYVRSFNPVARQGCEMDGPNVAYPGFPTWMSKGLLTSADVAPDALMMADMLKFLIETEVVISNSYHTIYWATLLGRKVILCNPWSTEFDHLKWPVRVYSGDLVADAQKAVTYPNAMKEAREANMVFAEEVRYQMGLPGSSSWDPTSGLLRPAAQVLGRVTQNARMAMIVLAVAVGLIVASLVTAEVKKRHAAKQNPRRDILPGEEAGAASSDARRELRPPPCAPPSVSAPQLGHPSRP